MYTPGKTDGAQRSKSTLSTASHSKPATSRSDGVSSVLVDKEMLVYGGRAATKIWALDLPSAKWSARTVAGQVPSPRVYHAAAAHGGRMLLSGGQPLVEDDGNPATDTGKITSLAKFHSTTKDGGAASACTKPVLLDYYELDVVSGTWEAVTTFGDIPLMRSYHTMTVADGDYLVLVGGKPVVDVSDKKDPANRSGNIFTAAELLEAVRRGFHDVHILHLPTRQWRRIEKYSSSYPMLWGHTTVLLNSALVSFGGMDVRSGVEAAAADPDRAASEAPTATLGDTVYVLDTIHWQWSEVRKPDSTEATNAWPAARAIHSAHGFGDGMVVFGGFTIDRFSRNLRTNDAWVWNPGSRQWKLFEFCFPQWECSRLPSVAYHSQLVVVNDMAAVHFYDFEDSQKGWQEVGVVQDESLVALSTKKQEATEQRSNTEERLDEPSDLRFRAAGGSEPSSWRPRWSEGSTANNSRRAELVVSHPSDYDGRGFSPAQVPSMDSYGPSGRHSGAYRDVSVQSDIVGTNALTQSASPLADRSDGRAGQRPWNVAQRAPDSGLGHQFGGDPAALSPTPTRNPADALSESRLPASADGLELSTADQDAAGLLLEYKRHRDRRRHLAECRLQHIQRLQERLSKLQDDEISQRLSVSHSPPMVRDHEGHDLRRMEEPVTTAQRTSPTRHSPTQWAAPPSAPSAVVVAGRTQTPVEAYWSKLYAEMPS